MKKNILLLACLLGLTFNVGAEVERRGSLDIGSGSIKLLVADVDTDTGQIVNYIYGDNLKVPFSNSLALDPNGQFNEEVQKQAIKAISTLIERSAKHEPNRFVGVATEAFRTAKNGKALADRIKEELGVTIFIIPQNEEAKLGFDSAIAHSKGDQETAVVWDIGSGSFQFSWKVADEIHSYTGKLGKVPTKNIVLAIQGKELNEKSSPNPISQEDRVLAKNAIFSKLDNVPEELRNKIQDLSIRLLIEVVSSVAPA